MSNDDGAVHGGRYYGRLTPGGPLVPVGDYDGPADAWICRRVGDFPHARIPDGGAVGACSRCGVAIGFNPARTIAAPKICMQCAHIRPLPITQGAGS